MFEFLRQLTSGITEAWSRLSANAKVQIGISAILSMVLLGGAVYLGAQPQFAQLYNGLEQSETNQIRIYLEDQGIPYKITDGGRAIEIPAKNASSVRVYLAGQQIPKSQGVSPDFGIFDQRSLMTNKFLQNVDYQRALQGTLQRHLNEFVFIRNSQVMIQKAEESLFKDHQMPSEAVVLLELVGGELSSTQKKALVHTISSFGGPNLSTNNITITTTTGDLIHSPVKDAYASLVSNRLEQQVATEDEREEKIERAFARSGRKVIIMVSALHDWSTEDVQSKKFDDENVITIAASEKKMKTTSTEGITANDGAPGAVANIPDAGGEAGSKEETTDNQTIENFEVGSTLTSTSKSPGSIKGFKISAIIEGDYEKNEDGTNGAYIGLTPAQLTAYEDLILYAVGDGEEASAISIMHQQFEVASMAPVAISAGDSFLRNPQLWQTVQGLMIILSFVLLRIFIRRAMVLPTAEIEETVELPQMSEEDRQTMEVAAEVERLSQEEPETVAALLRTWMAEDD